ncbi:MAG TPA: HAMP domain-containing sensor histidine kinase [Jatrophihabitans sp.]|nr:HAMP domain-containing sensor histidine kinase [Jatrophihabitans sp.]
MSADRLAAALRPWRWECAWALWAVANLVWMVEMPDWVSVPFHFIWVSLTVLFGFRLWSDAFTWTLVGLVVLSTGIVLLTSWAKGMPADELLEIPLMFAMFLAMMLHTIRRRAATAELQRVSEENARMLQRERSFVQNASHALRTPITVALAHAELARGFAVAESVKVDTAIVADELGRLRGLTDQLLVLATADAANLARPVPTDLTAVVAAAHRRWAPTPRRWSVVRHDEATVLADEDQLILALDAVIENAIKVTDDGAPIELAVVRQNGTAAIEVRDGGPGIAPELLDKLFERFMRGTAHRGATGGFGLGLAIVDAITQAHGGYVSAANRPEGGAVVAMHLPLADGAPAAPGGGDRSHRAHPPAAQPATAPAAAVPT